MADLCERLLLKSDQSTWDQGLTELLREAAAEIERLRADLQVGRKCALALRRWALKQGEGVKDA